jgi:glutathione synthase/RimK-type ligase-like ATP-grasp enzyme
MRIALATSKDWPNLAPDDRMLLRPLADRGFKAEPAVWSDANYPWQDCDAVVIRSCWDYHLHSEKFLHWIASLELNGCNVWNSPATIRWNIDKCYLRSLESQGIPVVPTFWHEPGKTPKLADVLADKGWPRAVIKPRISATAHRTKLIDAQNANAEQALFEELIAGPGAMVQPFIESIVRDGEWSLMFFGGQFSHAVVKTAKPGDFRVQDEFGGEFQAVHPPPFVLECATRTVRSAPHTLYARVDGVIDRSLDEAEFRIMELELIEPALYLACDPEAANRFADAIAALSKRKASFHASTPFVL